MLKNLESTGGLIFSGQLLLDLAESGMSREDAYRLVQSHAMNSWKNDLTFRDEIAKVPEITARLTPEKLARAFDYTPPAQPTSTPSSPACLRNELLDDTLSLRRGIACDVLGRRSKGIDRRSIRIASAPWFRRPSPGVMTAAPFLPEPGLSKTRRSGWRFGNSGSNSPRRCGTRRDHDLRTVADRTCHASAKSSKDSHSRRTTESANQIDSKFQNKLDDASHVAQSSAALPSRQVGCMVSRDVLLHQAFCRSHHSSRICCPQRSAFERLPYLRALLLCLDGLFRSLSRWLEQPRHAAIDPKSMSAHHRRRLLCQLEHHLLAFSQRPSDNAE